MAVMSLLEENAGKQEREAVEKGSGDKRAWAEIPPSMPPSAGPAIMPAP
jgi:hypothetical protein